MEVIKRHHFTILERMACAVGKGLIAGAVGMGAVTLAQVLEMRLIGRRPVTVPAEVTAKLLGIGPDTESSTRRFELLIHFIYGIVFGLARTLMRLIGLRGPVASTLHWVAVVATSMQLFPYLRLAPELKLWGVEKIAREALIHIPYAALAGLTYDRLTGIRRCRVIKKVEVRPTGRNSAKANSVEKKRIRA